MITYLLKKFGGWVLGVVALIGAFLTVWASSRNVGEAKAQAKAAKDAAKRDSDLAVVEMQKTQEAADKQVQAIKGASDVQNEVNKLHDGDAASRLRDKWNREPTDSDSNKNDSGKS